MAVHPIRPNVTPQPAAPARPADAARSAAQRAFFQAALGATEAPAAPAARAVKAVQPATRFAPQPARARIPEEPPTRILRPGSFIDIKV